MKINKLLSLCIGSIFAVGLAHASTHCNDYEIKIVNKLDNELMISKAQLIGAELQPKHEVRIAAHSSLVYTVSNTAIKKMKGEFVFKAISLPVRTIVLNLELRNGLVHCDFDNKGIKNDGLAVSESHSSSEAVYTIG